MALFITIGYGDEVGYQTTDQAVRDAAHAHDERLQSAGVRMGRAGQPVQVRNHDATGPTARFGSYLESALPVAGFAVIEADCWKRRSRWSPVPRARWRRGWWRSGRWRLLE